MFWDIIGTARASAGQDRPFHESLIDHLAILTEQDILEYYEPFEKMGEALYRYDLWAAAYLIGAAAQATANPASERPRHQLANWRRSRAYASR